MKPNKTFVIRHKETKQAIAICKAKQDVQWLQERGITPASNAAKRRQQIIDKLRKESKDALV